MTTRNDLPRGLFIADEWVEPRGGWYEITNPATEERIAEAANAAPSDVGAAVDAARQAFEGWSTTSSQERADVLDRILREVIRRSDDLEDVVQAETGCIWSARTGFHMRLVLSWFRRSVEAARNLAPHPLAPALAPSRSGGRTITSGEVARRPIGVVACIPAYNNPIGGMASKVGPALAMGNTVVLKAPPQDPLSILLLTDIIREAGVPAGVVNVLTSSGPEVGRLLVDSEGVDAVSFTGSPAVGMAVAEAAGRSLKRVLLELGGKGAAVILEDADLDLAVNVVASTFEVLAGQACIVPSRAVVHESLYDEFVERLVSRATSLQVGDPRLHTTDVGPLISADQRERVEGFIERQRRRPGRLVAGGERPAMARGHYVAPTIFADVDPDSELAQHEVFGPVACVMPFRSVEEAVAIANNSRYGLHNYVLGQDAARAYQVGGRLRSGTVSINIREVHPDSPIGGFGLSGIGRESGIHLPDAYSEVQTLAWA